MRILNLNDVTKAVKDLLLDANVNIGDDVLSKIRDAIKTEKSEIGKTVLKLIEENDLIARRDFVPMCQDTGIVVIFLEIGNQIIFDGDIYDAVNQGVREAYADGFLRKSVVNHPIERKNTKDNTPAIIHTKIIQGDKLKISVAPKGGGSENMSLVKMLIPADGKEGIKKLVLDTIFHSGGKPCPPLVVGIGIGGNLEKAAIIAKEAIFRPINDEAENPFDRELERELLKEINELGVGPMGFGGTTTALAVKVNSYPCHIASLPVAINIQCHAARHKEITI
ncbi:MAG TPA: fumarate hydratase [Acholeplasmataceae bacterium]|nr:fumarate hydratase [Acholeplasmataceae bacterium]